MTTRERELLTFENQVNQILGMNAGPVPELRLKELNAANASQAAPMPTPAPAGPQTKMAEEAAYAIKNAIAIAQAQQEVKDFEAEVDRILARQKQSSAFISAAR